MGFLLSAVALICAHLCIGEALLPSMIHGAVTTLESVAVWLVLRSFLGSVRDMPVQEFLAVFGAVGAVVPAISASVEALMIAPLAGLNWSEVWLGRWMSALTGASLMLPLVVSYDRARAASLMRGSDGRMMLWLSVLTISVVWGTAAVFHRPMVALVLPMLIAAFRLGALASAMFGAVISALVLMLTESGHVSEIGPMVSNGVFFAPWMLVANIMPFCLALLVDALKRERERISDSESHFREAMNHSPFGMALLNVDATILSVNRALCDLLGYEARELIGMDSSALVDLDEVAEATPRLKKLLRGEISEMSQENRLIRKDGLSAWVFVALSVVRDEKTGAPLYIIAQMKDIEDRRRAEKALEESESRWNFALESAGQGVWDHDFRRSDTFNSPMWSRMLGYEPGELPNGADDWLALIHPRDLPRLLRQQKQHRDGITEQFECEFRMRHKSGRWLWILDRGKVIVRDENGQPLRMIGTHTDISEHRRLAEALEEEKERLRITLHSIGDGVICTDAAGVVTFVNPLAEQLTGWPASSALGRRVEEVARLEQEGTDIEIESPVALCLKDLRRVQCEDGALLIGRSGARVDIEASASPVRKPSGELLGAVLVVQDVTRSRVLQKELTRLAVHDSLTGLYNRAFFEQALTDHCRDVSAEGAGHALCYLDLDRFKIINDTAGHAAGDALLREIGELIREQVRGEDIVARLGGDEFGLLFTDCPIEEAAGMAERLIERIGRVRFSWGGRIYEVGASVGIARLDAETPLVSDVMSRADVACYAAKAAGRNRVSVYHPSTGDARRHHAELHTAAGIRAALDADRFEVYAQKIRDLRPSGHLDYHAELLVRMRDGNGDLLAPGAFIPAAERYGLMASIDRWMIRQALHRYDRAILAVPRLSVSINLSANSLDDPGLLDFLAHEQKRSALPPHRIRFEITETSLINNLTRAGRLVEDLRAAGYAIMLDDFGAGVSSFAYLENFTVDYLKIDGGFIRKMATKPIDRAIVESINDIGHKIGAVTIAEFVEDQATETLVRKIGIDMAQGYHVARPVPIEDLLARLGARHAAGSGAVDQSRLRSG